MLARVPKTSIGAAKAGTTASTRKGNVTMEEMEVGTHRPFGVASDFVIVTRGRGEGDGGSLVSFYREDSRERAHSALQQHGQRL